MMVFFSLRALLKGIIAPSSVSIENPKAQIFTTYGIEQEKTNEVNKKKVESKEELMEQIGACEGESLILGVRRENGLHEIEVEAIKDKTGEYKLGIWVRDNAQGIGTLTFADEKGYFGALGHGINDMDTVFDIYCVYIFISIIY